MTDEQSKTGQKDELEVSIINRTKLFFYGYLVCHESVALGSKRGVMLLDIVQDIVECIYFAFCSLADTLDKIIIE